MTGVDTRPKQYHAEGTTDVGTYRRPLAFAAFLADGDAQTRVGVRVIFGGRSVRAQVQGRVITFERRERLSPISVRYVKCVEAVAERVHVQTIYALGWPS